MTVTLQDVPESLYDRMILQNSVKEYFSISCGSDGKKTLDSLQHDSHTQRQPSSVCAAWSFIVAAECLFAVFRLPLFRPTTPSKARAALSPWRACSSQWAVGRVSSLWGHNSWFRTGFTRRQSESGIRRLRPLKGDILLTFPFPLLVF